MKNICAYTNLSLVESELKAQGDNASAAAVIEGKVYVIQAINWITGRINAECQQEFEPRQMYKYFDATTDQALDPYNNSVILTKPLLDVIQVKVADTVMTRWTPDLPYSGRANYNYFLYPVRETPYYKLQSTGLFPFWSPFYFSPLLWWPQAAQQAIEVHGLWGFRTDYSTDAWANSTQTVLNAPLTVSGRTVNVTDASVFSPGMLLRFADGTTAPEDEMVQVTDADTTSMVQTITVDRHVQGTTATAHIAGTKIDIFQPEPNIVRAATRWTAYLYQRRAVYETLRVSVGASGSITSVFPQDAPEEIQAILGLYANFHFTKA